jgi:hypothetical protein
VELKTLLLAISIPVGDALTLALNGVLPQVQLLVNITMGVKKKSLSFTE